jgi:hypothetical protein
MDQLMVKVSDAELARFRRGDRDAAGYSLTADSLSDLAHAVRQ